MKIRQVVGRHLSSFPFLLLDVYDCPFHFWRPYIRSNPIDYLLRGHAESVALSDLSNADKQLLHLFYSVFSGEIASQRLESPQPLLIVRVHFLTPLL